MIIKNTSKSVKVLKAKGQPSLRLFPGYNDIGDINLKPYRNDVSDALFNDPKDACLSSSKGTELSLVEKEQAKAAKEKNEALNKAQRMIKANTKVKKADDKIIEKQAETIKDQAKLIADLTERMDAIENLADDEPKKTAEPEDKKKDKK